MKNTILVCLFFLLTNITFAQDMSIFAPYDFNGFKEDDILKLKNDVTTILKEKVLSKIKAEDNSYKKVEEIINRISEKIDLLSIVNGLKQFKKEANTVLDDIDKIDSIAEKKITKDIKKKVNEMFNNLEDSYRLQIYDHLSIGNNSQDNNTKFENLFAPSSSISFMYTFDANKKPEYGKVDFIDGMWGTFGSILNFSSQSTNSLDSINALAKILNYGPDVTLSFDARIGTVPHRYLKLFIGTGVNLAYINSKSIDNKIIDGVPMYTINVFGGIWALNDIIFAGLKWERRFTDQEGWLYENVNCSNTWNLYTSINFKKDLSILISYLVKTNRSVIDDQKSKNRLQVTFGTYFDLRGLKL